MKGNAPERLDVLIDELKGIFSNIKAHEIMNTSVVVIRPDRTLYQAKELMRLRKISGVPVCDEKGALVGIVSIEDIIKALENDYINDRIEKWMTKNVVWIDENEELIDIVEKFSRYGFGRFPVLNPETKKVIGIITKADILSTILKKLKNLYVRDQRMTNVLEKSDLHSISLITGEKLDKSGADFYFEINYSDINMAGIGAAKLREFLLSRGIDEETVRKVAIATYEAETNVVIHSESTGRIYCFVKDDFIKVRVEDNGKGIENLELAMQEGYSTAPDYVRELGFGAGMGLVNMKRCSDKMVVVSEVGKGVIVEMLFNIKLGGEKS
ncbi:MAG: hypothetical protein PWQ20_910 [Thermotogaceae bacterium]|jgi:CBS domain-containing protein/anti-sigma regulatory factor (Ser/Thr protein kinase)|nr:hypothetical protein [Thermotogaceae bacterium]MDN5337840.1 hypothetical protein [Thermotogaceae bacterium]